MKASSLFSSSLIPHPSSLEKGSLTVHAGGNAIGGVTSDGVRGGADLRTLRNRHGDEGEDGDTSNADAGRSDDSVLLTQIERVEQLERAAVVDAHRSDDPAYDQSDLSCDRACCHADAGRHIRFAMAGDDLDKILCRRTIVRSKSVDRRGHPKRIETARGKLGAQIVQHGLR